MSSEPILRADSLPRERGLWLKNLADFQTELARVAAGFLPGIANWPTRKELPHQIFLDFRMIQDLRSRHRELGVAGSDPHLSQAAPARELLDLLCTAPSGAEAIEAIYGRVKVRLALWLDEFLQLARSIYDLPSVPLLENNAAIGRAQTAWAAERYPVSEPPASDFQRAVDERLAEMPPALASPERRRAEPVRVARQLGRLPLLDGTVPDGFAARATIVEPPAPDGGYAARERFYAGNFLQEVQAADSCAAILFDAPDLPWDFYFDCARHMWDESRHAMFGEKKLAALGIRPETVGLSTTAYRLRQTLAPHDRYAALTTQEADAFPGKHAGLKEALENHDTLGAMTWSYDIADETQHVRYGQKWLGALITAMGDPRSPAQVRQDAENWRAAVLAATYTPQRVPPSQPEATANA